jgi:hypothetical protein
MFVELMPLLAGRTVIITVAAREDEKTLRVNVIPAPENCRKTKIRETADWKLRPVLGLGPAKGFCVCR